MNDFEMETSFGPITGQFTELAFIGEDEVFVIDQGGNAATVSRMAYEVAQTLKPWFGLPEVDGSSYSGRVDGDQDT